MAQEATAADLIYGLLKSRFAVATGIVGTVALVAAVIVRLIPFWLFVLILVLLVVGVVSYGFIARWWGKRKDERLLQSLDAQGLSDIGRQRVRDREALKALHEKWKESIDTLRKSRVGRRRQALYFLPWYVIIGSPACGKSTAIKNSGLHFPMGEPKLSGTGGTRNCDWWFAEEAIILDTAGRYTFNDENEPDREEWLSFLKLLRKNRPLAPLNGLLVAVAADGMLSRDRDEVIDDARNIRQKVDQIVRELGIQFPIYLLVTKCDLIEGFTDFFGRLPKRRLDEMLGWTNPSWEMSDPKKMVADALSGIRERALGMRSEFLWEEERPDALRRIYLFPEELRAFNRNLEDFCDILFRENQYNESPFLRGIYFTSGMQKGTAVSRMLERLGLRAQATELREEKRSYFLKDLFQGRLPADRSLVASTGRARGQMQVAHNLGFAAIASVCVLAAIVTGGSYVANRTLLLDVEDEVRAAVGKADRPPPERLAALDRYVDALERLDDRNQRRPLSAGWGLYTGYRVIEPARNLFLTRFETDAYTPAMEGARRVVRTRDSKHGFPGLEALIRNSVLSKILNGTHAEPPGPNEALAGFWLSASQKEEPLDEATAEHYARAYVAFLRWRDPGRSTSEVGSDLSLVREALPEMFTVDRVAAWADDLYPALVAQTDIPLPATMAAGARVRGAFRPEAWNERVSPLMDVVDLVSEDIDASLPDRFRHEYLSRYFADWLRFVTIPKDVPDSGVPTATLLSAQSPYLLLIDRTAAAVALDIADTERPVWSRTVTRISNERDNYLKQLDALSQQLSAAQNAPASAVQDAKDIFTSRVRLDADPSGGEGPADPFGRAERWVERTVAVGATDDLEDALVRNRLSALMRAPIYEGFGSYLRVVARDIDRQWQQRVVGASVDRNALTAPETGLLWRFYNEMLDPFLERPNYTAKVRYTRRLPFAPTLASYLSSTDKRNGARYNDGGGLRQFNLTFETVPSADPGEGSLRVTRTVLTVQCGGEEPWRLEHRQFRLKKALQWSPASCNRTELIVYVGQGDGDERPLDPIVGNDDEGLLEVLARARVRGDEFSWSFPGGFTATYIISTPGRFPSFGGGDQRLPSSIL